ncbi:MAG: head GIN domain-containing protein [Bacteroidales bacterium]
MKLIGKNKIVPLSIGLFLVLILSCSKSEFLISEPDIVKEEILPPFGEIIVNSIFDIELGNSPEFFIKMTGKKDILENISFQVKDGALVLTDGNSFRWLPDYPRVHITISFPDINSITLNTPSNVFSNDTLNVSDLSIVSEGNISEIDLTVKALSVNLRTSWTNFGNYTLKGQAENSNISIFGSARLDALELQTNNARISNSSMGNCYVNVKGQLRVWLGHYGNIYYQGSPEEIIIEKMVSRGRLIQIEAD